MRNVTLVMCACAGLLVAACSASAAPMIDGFVSATEYDYPPLDDTPNETGEEYYDTGLDVKTFYYDDASDGSPPEDWYWMGVEVVDPPIDPDGDPTSNAGMTYFLAIFLDQPGGSTLHTVQPIMGRVGGVATVMAVMLDGGFLGAAHWDGAVDDALEVRIKQSEMPNMVATPYVEGQLDGVGHWRDDQFEGYVPEPATLALLGAGLAGTALVRRRRRR